MAFDPPNYTQIPNCIFDHWMKILSSAQFSVLLCICRKTVGWHKKEDFISKHQIEEMTGLSEKTVRRALRDLRILNLIEITCSRSSQGDNNPNLYRLIIEERRGVSNLPPPPPQIYPPGVGSNLPPTKETHNTKEKAAASSCQKKSAAASSIEDQIKKSRIPKEERTTALQFYKDNPEKFKNAQNPIGLLVTIVDSGDHIKNLKDPKKMALRKEWGAKHEWTGPAGSRCCTKEGYVVTDGSKNIIYKWDSRDEFWEKQGL